MFKVDSKESLRSALLKLTERPGLFVGINRLDYLENFYAGWSLVTPIYPWNSDYEIQKWIFLKESVSIANAATIHGRSLIFRCYGNRMDAINKFKELLEDVEFNSYDDKKDVSNVSVQIFGLRSFFESIIEEDGYICPFATWASVALKQAANELVVKVQNTYESIIPIISRIISEPHDDLWVYLHYERYYLSVRFLYHTTNGEWRENTSLIDEENYFQNLLILHAYVAFVRKQEHEHHIITLHYTKGISTVSCKELADIVGHDVSNNHVNDIPLCNSYADWKEPLMSTPFTS